VRSSEREPALGALQGPLWADAVGDRALSPAKKLACAARSLRSPAQCHGTSFTRYSLPTVYGELKLKLQ